MKLPIFLTLALCAANPGSAEVFCYAHENVLGTSMDLRVDADEESAADAAEARVLQELDRLAGVLSTYSAESEISTWLAGSSESVRLSDDLHAVLAACDAWEKASDGAFNARVEAISRLWKRSAAEWRRPSDQELQDAVAAMRAPAWNLGADGMARRLGNAPVTVSALAKGYIIDRAGERGMDAGGKVRGLLLNIGGDARAWGNSQVIAVANPRADAENAAPLTHARLQNGQAIATSGGYRRGVLLGGRMQSHIIDPRTGEPAGAAMSATVCAPDCVTADALATIFCILPPQQSLEMADRLPGVRCLLVTGDGRELRSRRWEDAAAPGHWSLAEVDATQAPAPGKAETKAEPAPLLDQREWKLNGGMTIEAALLSVSGDSGKFRRKDGKEADIPLSRFSADDRKQIADAVAANWSAQFELAVDYEINAPSGGRYHRPYVAIWLEDAEGNSIRTLTLLMKLGKGGKWLPDLKQWFRADKKRRTAGGADVLPTISAATRNPGSYSVVWDGKDDAGAAVKAGKFTLFVETAREHGPYQILKKEISVGGSAFEEKAEGNEEIKEVKLAYRRKAKE
jgi:thiamine biosynthesis lipoprotein ApbE